MQNEKTPNDVTIKHKTKPKEKSTSMIVKQVLDKLLKPISQKTQEEQLQLLENIDMIIT